MLQTISCFVDQACGGNPLDAFEEGNNIDNIAARKTDLGPSISISHIGICLFHFRASMREPTHRAHSNILLIR